MNNGAEDIVKALRCCSNGSCSECFFRKDKQNCQEAMEFMAADMIERLSKENERLRYTLLGVMHSVDKWVDDKPRYYDIEDPDGNIAVNRAAEAREIALRAIEKVERERDAAVNDLSLNANCAVCENYAKCAEWMSTRCAGFIDAGNASPFFEWRGVVKENCGGADDSTAYD